jgi:hypothetical protein
VATPLDSRIVAGNEDQDRQSEDLEAARLRLTNEVLRRASDELATSPFVGPGGPIPYGAEPIIVRPFTRSDHPNVARFDWAGPTEDWYVQGVVTDTAAGLAISDIRVYPRPNRAVRAGGLTNDALRGIHLGHLLTVVRSRLAHEQQRLAEIEASRSAEWGAILGDDQYAEYVASVKAAGTLAQGAARRGGKPPLPHAYYRRAAVLYLRELDNPLGRRGLSERVAKQLSKEVGRTVPPDTARDWVQKARNRFHYLTPTKQGRAAGTQATPRLLVEWAEGQKPLGRTGSRASRKTKES